MCCLVWLCHSLAIGIWVDNLLFEKTKIKKQNSLGTIQIDKLLALLVGNYSDRTVVWKELSLEIFWTEIIKIESPLVG